MMRRAAPLLILLALAGCGESTSPEYVAEVDAWHADRVARLTTDTGWLTLVGLHPLEGEFLVLGSAPEADVRLIDKAPARIGVLTQTDAAVTLTADPAAHLSVDDTILDTPLVLVPDVPGPPTIVAAGDLLFHLIERGGKRFLRVKDTKHPALKEFAGIERYPVDARWRVTARLEPHDPPRGVLVPNVLGQLEEQPSPGVLVFELDGKECRLTPVGAPGEGLFLVFADATSGHTTYGGGRFLSTAPPGPDGTVVLDFNRSVSPPCAFSAYATCPLPPEGNTLAVAVEAGEKSEAAAH